MSCLSQLSLLNTHQQEAVCWPQGHLLVLAGAGSGKTRVLVTRIAWLMETQGVPLHSVLVVTFTNKAARELVERIQCLLGVPVKSALVGTFHHICHHMLRIHAQAAGLQPSFDIIDHGDQVAIIKRILKELNISVDVVSPFVMCQSIHKAKQSLQRVNYWAHTDDRLSRLMVQVYEKYEACCQRENLVDFTEVLLRCYELLAGHDDLLAHYQHRLKHILVDEFQDTNALQYAWLKLLASGGQNQLFVVGDDDQSIYSFRGADTSNMALFIQEFAGDNVVRLEQNYRSRPMILEAANALIARNTARLGKKLWTEADDTEPLPCVIAPDDLTEAQWIAERCAELRRTQPEWRIVILYRTNIQAHYFEQSLFALGIPYRIFGGLRFLDRAEIKHVLAYMRLMVNQDDNTAFLRIINFPTRGIGEKTIQRIAQLASDQGVSYLTACTMMTGAKATVLKCFIAQMTALGVAAKEMPLASFLQHLLEVMGINEVYAQEKDYADKRAHFDQLRDLMIQYHSEIAEEGLVLSAWDTIAQFIAHLHLDGAEVESAQDLSAVHLMTVHMAKGLEYEAVFVTGLEQALFPNEKSLKQEESIEEERRLMYVAMTRAKKALYLSYARRRHMYNQTFFHTASQFLSEIPQRFLRFVDLSLGAPTPSKAYYRSEKVTELGKRVRHEHFGDGTVISVTGTGEQKQLEVRFDRGVTKSLLMAWAPLQFLSS